jgi:hypothetical protein
VADQRGLRNDAGGRREGLNAPEHQRRAALELGCAFSFVD